MAVLHFTMKFPLCSSSYCCVKTSDPIVPHCSLLATMRTEWKVHMNTSFLDVCCTVPITQWVMNLPRHTTKQISQCLVGGGWNKLLCARDPLSFFGSLLIGTKCTAGTHQKTWGQLHKPCVHTNTMYTQTAFYKEGMCGENVCTSCILQAVHTQVFIGI